MMQAMLRLFRKRYRIRELLPEACDTHSHLLPQADDGIRSHADALRLIASMKSMGLKECICTPHISLRFPQNEPEGLRRIFLPFREQAAGMHPDFRLHLSAEYMIDERFPQLLRREQLLPWPVAGDSRPHLLVEMPTGQLPMGWADTLCDILSHGYIPVLAHPERYHRLLSADDFRRLHQLGIRFQGNIGSLGGLYGKTAQELCLTLHREKLYYRWGSDAHTPNAFAKLPLKP